MKTSDNLEKAYLYYEKGVQLSRNDGKHREALIAFSKVEKLAKGMYDVSYCKAIIYSELKKHENVVKECAAAVKRDPQHKAAYGLQGNAYLFLEKYKEALRSLNSALKYNKHCKFYFDRGLTLGKLNKHAEAIKDFNLVLKEWPKFSNCYFNRGVAYFKLGKKDNALKDFRKVLALDPKDCDAKEYIEEL